jgi:anti-sigma B factor antagonist
MGHSAYNWMEIDQVRDVTVVRFTTRAIVDERTIKTIGDELGRLVEKLGNDQLILDFSTVTNVSSSVLTTLIMLNQQVKNSRGRLALTGISPDLQQVFKLTKLEKLFNIYGDEASALQSF